MARFIDADVLIEMRNNKAKTDYEMGLYNHGALTQSFIRFVEGQPTADVAEVKHGEWRHRKKDRSTFECSVCGTLVGAYIAGCTDFCPDCGARMDGERKDDKTL